MSWAEALGLVVRLETVPYGYTLAVWSAGAICIGHYGWPRIGDVLLFVAGAVSGYLMLVLLAAGLGAGAPQGPVPALLPTLNLAPALPPVVVAVAVRRIGNRTVGYFAIGFLATLTYTCGLVLLVRLLG